MSHPTADDELNALLRDLVACGRSILGPSLVGAYLQGSFALGDADRFSDCDFLIAVREPLDCDQEQQLRALHAEIPTRPGFWSKHLEGSYPVTAELRTVEGIGRPWLYVDHGWQEMSWNTHCNTEVARWILRGHGVVLAGPHPAELVDPLPVGAMQARMRRDIVHLLDELATWIDIEAIAWAQRYAVTTVCRQLFTLETGRVASKRAALDWAVGRLGPAWAPLVRQAGDDRGLGWDPGSAPRPDSVEATRALAAEAARIATQ